MKRIADLRALEILDSRGRPTVKAWCTLESGFTGTASVPSGASSGASEAHELRDRDPNRYAGLGCRKAVLHIDSVIAQEIKGRDWIDQSALDAFLVELDGSSDKSRLGANAILAVSLAFCRAAASEEGAPLFAHLAAMIGTVPRLPRPTINLFSGGLHAGGQVPIQDVLVVPAAASSIDEALAHTFAVYQAAAELAESRYGYRLLRADEGGLAPPFSDVIEMLDMAVESIEAAGFRPGEDVSLAVDVASSHFYEESRYKLGKVVLDSGGMIDQVSAWVGRYPIVSVEDGLAEEDWEAWPELKVRLEDRARVVGDDLLCTNPLRTSKAVALNAADTLLLKVNQIGTLSEAAHASTIAREAGWHVTVSARSGETEDDWLADLAVGWAGNQIKVGSITQSERLAKYNRLLHIEKTNRLEFESWPKM